MNYYVKVWILCTCLDMAYILNNCEAQVWMLGMYQSFYGVGPACIEYRALYNYTNTRWLPGFARVPYNASSACHMHPIIIAIT